MRKLCEKRNLCLYIESITGWHRVVCIMKQFSDTLSQLGVSVAMKRLYGHGNSYKAFNWGLVYSSEVVNGGNLAYRQTWYWRGTWDFYIWIGRQQEEETFGLAWSSEISETFPSNTLLPSRVRLLKVPFPIILWGHFHSNHHACVHDSFIDWLIPREKCAE